MRPRLAVCPRARKAAWIRGAPYRPRCAVWTRRRDAHHIAHDANRECLALIRDEAEFHLGASEKICSVFFRISRSMRRRSFSRRRRAFSATKSAPACGITACVLERRGEPACLPSSLLRQAKLTGLEVLQLLLSF